MGCECKSLHIRTNHKNVSILLVPMGTRFVKWSIMWRRTHCPTDLCPNSNFWFWVHLTCNISCTQHATLQHIPSILDILYWRFRLAPYKDRSRLPFFLIFRKTLSYRSTNRTDYSIQKHSQFYCISTEEESSIFNQHSIPHHKIQLQYRIVPEHYLYTYLYRYRYSP